MMYDGAITMKTIYLFNGEDISQMSDVEKDVVREYLKKDTLILACNCSKNDPELIKLLQPKSKHKRAAEKIRAITGMMTEEHYTEKLTEILQDIYGKE